MPLNLGLGTLNIYTQVGLITLIGPITKHGILLVRLSSSSGSSYGMRRRDAIVASPRCAADRSLTTPRMASFAVMQADEPRYSMGLVISAASSSADVHPVRDYVLYPHRA